MRTANVLNVNVDAWNSVDVSENVKMNLKKIFMNLMGTLSYRLLWNCLIIKNLSRTLGTFKTDLSLTLINSLQAFTNVSKTSSYNLGQKVWDKLTKLSKTGFPMECFTADFLQLFPQKRQNLPFGWTAGFSPLKSKHFRDFLEIF